MITEYHAPTDVLFGKDAVSRCSQMLGKYGAHKILIHYGSERVVRTGLMAMITDQLDACGMSYVMLGGAQPNPRLSLVYKGIEMGRTEGVDFILAVGGGSAIDSAKAIAYGLADDGDVWDFYSGIRKPSASLPLGVVLTLSATGSEMSDSSVITNEDGGLKRGCNSDLCRPRFALLDPALTFTVPPYQTSCGTADIMMHTIERFFHSGSSLGVTDSLAMALVKNVIENGKKALQEPENYDVRANLMWASSLSHNGLMQLGNDQRGDWACHQMEHELSGMYDVAHGAGLTAIWGSWARYVFMEDPERFALFGEGVFGLKRTSDAARDAMQTIKAMENCFTELHMPKTLKELGLEPSDEEINELAEKASFFDKRTIGSFKVLDKDDIRAIYTAAKG